LIFSKGVKLLIDIGAHETLLVGARHPNCKITAFEPVLENFEVLERNGALDQLPNIELLHLAVSDGAPRAKLAVHFPTPMWDDISATRWRIPPWPKAVVSCCRDKEGLKVLKITEVCGQSSFYDQQIVKTGV
jgi:FkbM family methyltransferase